MELCKACSIQPIDERTKACTGGRLICIGCFGKIQRLLGNSVGQEMNITNNCPDEERLDNGGTEAS